MERWKQILESFLEDYKNKDYVIGAILCGSYATGNNTKRSDIDVHIVTTDISYKQRGNVIVDGIMIEYFMNPLSELYKYLENDYKQRRRLADANMYGHGVILFDKNGEIEKLKKYSLKYYDMDFDEPEKNTILYNNYVCWDLMDEIKDKIDNNENFDLDYYMLLKELISNYYYKNKIATVPFTKIEKIFRNENYRKKYHIKNMPTKKFVDLVLDAIDNKSFDNINELYNFVMGEFKITDFILKTEINYE